MAVFYDTGGGDIYGGESREDIIKAMRFDLGDDFDESAIEELDGGTLVEGQDENEDPTDEKLRLDEVYTPGIAAHCIASSNQ